MSGQQRMVNGWLKERDQGTRPIGLAPLDCHSLIASRMTNTWNLSVPINMPVNGCKAVEMDFSQGS